VTPDLTRLTAVPEKGDAFSDDLFFRECFADVEEILGADAMRILGSLAVLTLKPDAVVGRRMTAILDYAVRHGFVPIATVPFHLTRHSMREIWRYDWHVYTVDRLAFSTLWYTSTDVLLFAFRDDDPAPGLPASMRLAEMKGAALAEKRTPDQLRSVLRPPNRILNFVHICDEPADIVRELGIFFDRAERRSFLAAIAANWDADRYGEASQAIAALEARYPAHDLDLESSLRRVEQRSEAGAARVRDVLGSGGTMSWNEVSSALGAENVDRWDLITIATHVIEYERDVESILPGPSAARWMPPSSRMLDHVVSDARAWTPDAVPPARWMLHLTGEQRVEIESMAAAMRKAPLPLLLRHPDQFALDACRALMAEVKKRLLSGPGMVIVDRLPLDDLSPEEATAVYWILGHFLATPVATKWDGTMLYDVTDTGRTYGFGVRGSATSVALSFHTDNAFGIALPDYVGLLCLQPASHGGVSRFCSLYVVHNEMLREYPRLLQRLYEPMIYDRQAEHAPDAENVLRVPLFSYDGQRLSARLTPNLVRRGYELAGREMDQTLSEALDCLESIVGRDELSIELTLDRGQMQFTENRGYAHARSAFTDAPDAARKRHLVRCWYRERGGPAYDG